VLARAFKKAESLPQSKPERKIIIAVDGPAASGKGTVAKALAVRLGYAYLDTGAIYRAVALAVLENGGDPSKPEDVIPALEVIKRLTPELLANPALRSPEVAEAATRVAALPEARSAVRDYQVSFAKNPPGAAAGVVLDGRDIGTVVCPDADIKFFITAAPEERARRRFEELKGRNPELTQETVLHDINERDRRDTSRKISPLRPAADAHVLDTTGLTPAESTEKAMKVVRAKFPQAGNDNAPDSRKSHKPDI
jgi:cytidylate kinase